MDLPVPLRSEHRSAREVVVTLFSVEPAAYEVTTTRNVSKHGACVLTQKRWPRNEFINVRSHQCSFFGIARTVRCRCWKGDSYLMGLEFIFSSGDWAKTPWQLTGRWATAKLQAV